MTVREVIEELQKLPQDLPVAIFNGNERMGFLRVKTYPDEPFMEELRGVRHNFCVDSVKDDIYHLDLFTDGLKIGDLFIPL